MNKNNEYTYTIPGYLDENGVHHIETTHHMSEEQIMRYEENKQRELEKAKDYEQIRDKALFQKQLEAEAKERYETQKLQEERQKLEEFKKQKQIEEKHSGNISKITTPLKSKTAIQIINEIFTTYEHFMKNEETKLDERQINLIQGKFLEDFKREHGFNYKIKIAKEKGQRSPGEANYLYNAVKNLQSAIQEKWKNGKKYTSYGVSGDKNPYINGQRLEDHLDAIEKLKKAREHYNAMNPLQKFANGKKLEFAIANEQMRQLYGEADNIDNIIVNIEGRKR